MGRGRIERITQVTHSAEETMALGATIGKTLKPGTILCFFGDLGAGKTTLIKGIVHALTHIAPEEVCSPTFAYLNIYEGRCPVFHFDLYRLKGAEDFLGLGFDEYLISEGVCCLEWSERIQEMLPAHAAFVTMTHEGEDKRKIIYEIPQCSIS